MAPPRKGFSSTLRSRMIAGAASSPSLSRTAGEGFTAAKSGPMPLSNFPEFGHSRRADFVLAEGIDHLNHGSYGATPRSVLDAARRWRLEMEGDPSTFFRRDLP